MYTRSGDDGETSLVGGQRINKSDLRVESFGEVDELNSVIGVCRESLPTEHQQIADVLAFIQQELFDIGAELATSPSDASLTIPRAHAAQIIRLETWCDFFNQGLPELKSFIVPGGSLLAAQFHQARTVCRRAERRCAALQSLSSEENPEILRYLNRLSDLLFIQTRWLLRAQNAEPGEWLQPEQRKIPVLS